MRWEDIPWPTKIMLIRYAETPYSKHFGVTEHGDQLVGDQDTVISLMAPRCGPRRNRVPAAPAQ